MKTMNKAIIGMAITATLLLNFLLLSAAIRRGPGPVKNIVLRTITFFQHQKQ
jgi:hypothetical protein